MPTSDLTVQASTVGRYGVIGTRSRRAAAFVEHVALHDADSCLVHYGERIPVAHMRPPFKHGDRIEAHVAGHVPLNNEEIKEIEAWLAEIEDELATIHARQQYIIHPPWEDQVDENTGVRRYRRYSCAGFVLDSHRQVEIELLITDEQALPEVDEATLSSIYPQLPRGRLRKRFGLSEEGPWRIVLAGYVLHALKRTSEQIRGQPYKVCPGDERI